MKLVDEINSLVEKFSMSDSGRDEFKSTLQTVANKLNKLSMINKAELKNKKVELALSKCGKELRFLLKFILKM